MQLFFSVGEPSGDHHAAELIHSLRELIPASNVPVTAVLKCGTPAPGLILS